MALLTRRLRCFYCGQRSASKKSTSVREWCCEHCEAVNYLDENGEITDPPTTVTDNPAIPNDTQSPFESAGFDQTGLFCSKCVRNQHLLMKALGSYLPDSDDPTYPIYEQQYPQYRRKMEETYPQVCENCEQKVNRRIRQTGYEAKADHLRRTMERSKMSRAVQKARRRNWRSILVVAGALGYWMSVVGQLVSDLIGACGLLDKIAGQHWPLESKNLSFISDAVSYIGYSSEDLAGIALLLGALSIWWNPKIHHKVEGLSGRILGLNQYYECQLIVMVARFAVWAWLKDTSRMEPSFPAAVHAIMILFMSVATVFSQRLVHYDTRPLVLWSNLTPVASPRQQKIVPQSVPTTKAQGVPFQQDMFQRFPLEKLSMPRESPKPNTQMATPPLEPEDSMDWTPSVAQEIRPMFVTSKPEATPQVVSHKSIFQGALPAAPRPPAWQLRNPINQKPSTPVPVSNVFQTSRTSQQSLLDNEQNNIPRTSDVFFAPPKFFAPSDYHATTGLESLFDQTFTIKSPEDDIDENAELQSKVEDTRKEILQEHALVYSSIRLLLLFLSILAWSIDWLRLVPIPHDAVLMGTLILNILFTGFGLLASLNQPLIVIQRVVYSLIKFVATLVLALCLSYNFSSTFSQSGNLELCVKSLTALLAIEESLILFSAVPKTQAQKQKTKKEPEATAQPSIQHTAEIQTNPQNQYSSPPPASPTLSYISNQPTSVYSQASLSQSQHSYNYGLYQRDMRRNPFLDDGSDASEISGGDSDAETTISSYTNKSIRNRNPFENDDRNYLAPRAPGLGSGLQGLSLDDSPISKRVTRSQTTRTGMGSEPVRYSRRLR
ncbi:hypothetical protein EYB26_001121 [Talaromyces marneffei]|uniref:uncharacterized protein n=1 Tax=Talaromyces marneffei TaxID=37727 RepID=UPI0012A84957|nr:uncharacterized protein EYB26_001121 [Talaromyces marneffei]QGA13471.1 hypothetical protein EYB26_001121 [Talaromyces marneffei]